MTDIEKEIREMAKAAFPMLKGEDDKFINLCLHSWSYWLIFERIYKAGYRKADEVRKELEEEQIYEMQEHTEFCALAEKKVNELTHRAEVAERALYNALEKFPCAQCGFECPDFSDYDEEAKYCNKKWLEQAEKELAEERK